MQTWQQPRKHSSSGKIVGQLGWQKTMRTTTRTKRPAISASALLMLCCNSHSLAQARSGDWRTGTSHSAGFEQGRRCAASRSSAQGAQHATDSAATLATAASLLR